MQSGETQEQKQLLFVGHSENKTQHLAQEMTSRGWFIKFAEDSNQASQLIQHDPCNVGLMHLCCERELTQTDTEALINDTCAEWIALVDRSALSNNNVVNLLKQFFYAYHTLPGDPGQLDTLLSHASAKAKLLSGSEQQNNSYEDGPCEYEMVGTSPSMRRLFETIRKVAAVDAPVLISGESGTGKELTAHAIHERSARRNGPFNAVNCAALPSNLIQSELFGHEKGSFTGATQRKIGRIEATAGGTILLDEIGDLPLEAQINLLRFLEGNFIQRVGSVSEIHVDVRVIAATHVNLEQAVAEQRFREDLYHRLNVLQAHTPALRERQDDIELLAKFFFDKFSCEKTTQLRGFSQHALNVMRKYAWPGNVRELINRVRRALVMCDNRLIRPTDMGLERRQSPRHVMTLEQARKNAERKAVLTALANNRFNIQRAANDLSISRITLYRLIDKHQIQHNRPKH